MTTSKKDFPHNVCLLGRAAQELPNRCSRKGMIKIADKRTVVIAVFISTLKFFVLFLE